MMIAPIGTEIGVSQARGRGELDTAVRYARAALYIAVTLGLLYASFLYIFNEPLVGLFNFREQNVADDTALYLRIMAFGIPFTYISSAAGSSFNASGNSKTPFLINFIGLSMNMILDPIFIFPLGMGVFGAALASVISQASVAVIMMAAVKKSKNRPFESFRIFAGADVHFSVKGVINDLKGGYSSQIFRWTIPICLESTLFCFLTMIVSRFEVSFGAHVAAVSRVCSQVESLSWLVGGGFGSAMVTFVGQNYGAGKVQRISDGVRVSLLAMAGWGLMVSSILAFAGGFVFSLFLPDPGLRDLGIRYMLILAVCQIPMNLEAVAGNAFRGLGKTIPPSVSNISSNIIRVPLAYVLSLTSLGLYGIWIAISLSACIRGIWIWFWYIIKKPHIHLQNAE